MDFLADECVFKKTVEYLRGLGHNVVTALESGLNSARNGQVARKAGSLNRVLITNDKDFANIIHFPPGVFCGIIVLKINRTTLNRTHLVLKQTLSELSSQTLLDSLVVIDHNGYRIRKKSPDKR